MEHQPERAIGAVLAGGQSARMGRDKVDVEIDGVPMLDLIVIALRAAGCEPLVIGRTTAPEGVTAVLDDLPGRAGPAAGLVTALRLAAGRDVFLVATDQPLLRPRTVRGLLALEGEAVVPRHDGMRQATCAVYRRECLDTLEELMRDRPSPPLQRLLDRVATRDVSEAEWSRWGEDGRSWRSLDTQEDVTEAEAWLRRIHDQRRKTKDSH